MGGSEDQEGEGSPIFQGRFESVCYETMVCGGILDGFGEFILCVPNWDQDAELANNQLRQPNLLPYFEVCQTRLKKSQAAKLSSSTPDVSSTPQQPEIGSSTSRAANQDQATRETNSANKEADMIDLDDEEGGNAKKRAKTSNVWSEFKDVSLSNGVEVGECVHCKKQLKKNKSKSTSQFKRHLESCVRRKIFQNQQKKITFQPKDVGDGDIQLQPALTNGKFDMAKVREAAAHWILMHEHPFSIVEEEGFNMMQKHGMPEWEKVSHVTIKKDCVQVYEVEKKKLKALLRNVNKIFLTTDLWRSSNQKIEYMVLTAYFIDLNWSGGNVKSHKSGMSEILTYVKTLYSGPPQESDLDAYLLKACFIHLGDPDQFDALEWWKANSLRFRILSQMTRDILAIPITTVASEAAFSARSRVIDTYWASLAPETVQTLLCGGDWCRNLHGVKKKNKNEKKSIEVELK
ncbi:putative Zinc finger, BED-type [Corchorus olitorius]|uniref:Zinc finger, BED-type n=1 Tax=Corchorus olitorius TaxID=93759 RepID=A0A1R3G0N7_9ROSI|nr:putative Zinc finger, BED-type [Corchorus olitorius]